MLPDQELYEIPYTYSFHGTKSNSSVSSPVSSRSLSKCSTMSLSDLCQTPSSPESVDIDVFKDTVRTSSCAYKYAYTSCYGDDHPSVDSNYADTQRNMNIFSGPKSSAPLPSLFVERGEGEGKGEGDANRLETTESREEQNSVEGREEADHGSQTKNTNYKCFHRDMSTVPVHMQTCTGSSSGITNNQEMIPVNFLTSGQDKEDDTAKSLRNCSESFSNLRIANQLGCTEGRDDACPYDDDDDADDDGIKIEHQECNQDAQGLISHDQLRSFYSQAHVESSISLDTVEFRNDNLLTEYAFEAFFDHGVEADIDADADVDADTTNQDINHGCDRKDDYGWFLEADEEVLHERCQTISDAEEICRSIVDSIHVDSSLSFADSNSNGRLLELESMTPKGSLYYQGYNQEHNREDHSDNHQWFMTETYFDFGGPLAWLA